MVKVRVLAAFDPVQVVALGMGYTSNDRYDVVRSGTAEHTAFDVRLVELLEPYHRSWSLLPEDIGRYERFVADDGASFGAYDGETLVGVAVCEPQSWNRSLTVWEFHVHTSRHREGIGRMLMDAVVANSGELGLSSIVCETQNTNVPAVRFYRAMGFDLEGIDVGLYAPEIPEVAFFMRRRV